SWSPTVSRSPPNRAPAASTRPLARSVSGSTTTTRAVPSRSIAVVTAAPAPPAPISTTRPVAASPRPRRKLRPNPKTSGLLPIPAPTRPTRYRSPDSGDPFLSIVVTNWYVNYRTGRRQGRPGVGVEPADNGRREDQPERARTTGESFAEAAGCRGGRPATAG